MLVAMPGLILGSCSRTPSNSAASRASSTPPTEPAESPITPRPTTSGWPTYSDARYRFSVQYPPTFTFEVLSRTPPPGFLNIVRFYDRAFEGTEPNGQIEVHILEKDADTLESWLAKHTRSSSDSDSDRPEVFWLDVTGRSQITAAGKTALSFDWIPAATFGAHEVIFFRTSTVVNVGWFAESASYAATMRAVFAQFLDSYVEY